MRPQPFLELCFRNLAMPSKQKETLHFYWYYLPIFTIALGGLANMIYLYSSHYRIYTDIGYESFCAISRAINCDTVSQSPYSVIFNMPVAVWGILGHLFVLYILLLAGSRSANKQRMWPLQFWIALAFTAYSLVLAYISTFYIHSYCIMCILGYLINFAMLYYAWFINRRFGNKGLLSGLIDDILFLKNHWKTSIPIVIVLLIFSSTGPLWFPRYWQMDPPILSKNMPTGITEDGHPWIGAKNPDLIITEFSDYRCFQCKKMHYFLRRIIETNPNTIRLVHRHFPMDHIINPLVAEPFHSGAAKLSMLAIFAVEYGKFWEMNDYLFNLPRDTSAFNIKKIAKEVGLEFATMKYVFHDQQLWNILWEDIKEGIKIHELTGTPGFIVNGKVYLGQIPGDLLAPYLK